MLNTSDVLLINPGGRKRIYQSLSDDLAAIENPVWVGLLASFLIARGRSVSVLDANAENLSPAECALRAADMNHRLTVVTVYGHNPSASTQMMPSAGAICREIKKLSPDHPVMLLGGHVSALPLRTLEDEEADYTCRGEGPLTILSLLEALEGGRPEDIEKVPGLVLRGRDLGCTVPAPLIEDPSVEMPQMPWHLLPMSTYRAHNWHCFGGGDRKPYAAIYTTLGCPYKCSFCCIQAPFKPGEAAIGMKNTINSYRFFDPRRVIGWIDTLVQEYGVRNIKFADEMFVLNKRHVEAICDLIIERGYDLNIWAYARVDTVQDALLEKMRRAGVTWLAFGIEAGSSKVRDAVSKSFSRETIRDAIERVKRAGFSVGGNFIFGLPQDDHQSMQETLDLAIDLQPEYANFYCAMAYPGSALYDDALRSGARLPKTWAGYSQHAVDCLPLATSHLESHEVVAFRDAAFKTFYSDPSYLSMMERKFGRAALDEIRFMTSFDLERAAPAEPRMENAGP